MATATKKSAKKPDAKPAPAKKPAEKPVVKTAPPTAKAAAAKPAAAPAKKAAPAKPAAAPAKKAAAPAAKTVTKAAAKPVAAPKAAAKAAPAKPVAKSSTKPVAQPAKPVATATKVASTAMPATSKTASPAKTVEPTKKPAAKKATAKAPAGVISEAELVKMSDKDYMNAAQLEFFRHRLVTMKEEILVNARETGEHLKENEVFADPNDRATVEEENMLEQRVRDRERKLLKKIDSALRRIEEGEYGFCLETGDPIGIPRLLARPTAELSIEAQEKHERLEKLFAD